MTNDDLHLQLRAYINSRSQSQLTDEEWRMITAAFLPLVVKKRKNIVSYNEVCKKYYFINQGSLRLYTVNSNGVETTRYLAFENMFCTALPSFITQEPASEFVQALEDCALLEVSRKDFYTFTQTIPAFSKIYVEILERGFVMAQKRIYSFQGDDALEQLKLIMRQSPGFLTRVSNRVAASFLGISPSTLSRLKSKL